MFITSRIWFIKMYTKYEEFRNDVLAMNENFPGIAMEVQTDVKSREAAAIWHELRNNHPGGNEWIMREYMTAKVIHISRPTADECD